MFGSSEFRVAQQSASQLRIVAPGWSFAQSWISLVIAGMSAAILYLAMRSIRKAYALQKTPEQLASLMHRERWFGFGLVALCLVVLWMIGYTRGEIDLDKTTNQATMRSKMTIFMPERVQTAPLANFDEAWLDAKPNARRIRLLGTHGADLAYPIWSDRPGQQQAVTAINAFLGKAGR